MDFENKISDLGFVIDIPKNWVKLDPKNKNCFELKSLLLKLLKIQSKLNIKK